MRTELKGALAAGLIATIALAGCAQFKGEVKGKEIAGERVRIAFKVCNSLNEKVCPLPTRAARGGDPHAFALIGLRVPKGSDVPKRFKPKNSNLRFKRNGSYSGQLNRKVPPKAGQRWVGYASKRLTKGNAPAVARIALKVGLPSNAGRKFPFNVAVGHAISPTKRLTKVQCGTYPFEAGSPFDSACITDLATEKVGQSIKVPLD